MGADRQHEAENQNGAVASNGAIGNSIQDFNPPKKPKTNKFAFACAILACMTSILLGYDIGVMSGAVIFIRKDIKMTDVQEEVLMGILNLYSLLGSAAAGRTSDLIGRRYTIVLAGAIFFLGALLMGFATNYVFLMFGRFVAGIGIGYALVIAPVYTAEVSPSLSRGFLTSFPEVFINGGILLGYVSNYAFSKLPQHLGWRFMLGVGAIPSIVIGFSVLALPESPRWLVMQGRLGDAKRVLQKTSESKEEAELRLSDIREAAGIPEEYDDEIIVIPKRNKGSGVWRELFLHPTPAVRHILIVGVGMHFFQQAVGIDAVVLYSPTIFGKAGITNSDHKLLATIGVGFVKTLSILIATFLVDRIGRRPLLLSSIAGMIGSLMGLATFLTIIDRSSTRLMWAIVLCILSTLSYVAFFSIGIGPVTWVYSSEIFPLRLRAQGCAAGVFLNRATSGLLTMTFISLYKAITIGGAFFLYAAIAAVSWLFFYLMMPETQGRTLEEIEKLFGRYCRWRTSIAELDGKKKNGIDVESNFNGCKIGLGENTIDNKQG